MTFKSVIIALMLTLLGLVGCSAQGVPVQGKLLYVTHQGLGEFDLVQRKEPKLLIDQAGRSSFVSIDRMDSSRFLIGSREDRGSKVEVLNKQGLALRWLRSGERAVYMPKHQKFFYFERTRLFLADINVPEKGVPIAADKGEFDWDSRIIPISDDEVVFAIRGDAGVSPPYRYNLVTNHLEQLPFHRPCVPSVWRSASQQLICWDSKADKNYLISMDGQRLEDLDNLPKGSPILYIPQEDVLLLMGLRLRLLPLSEEYPLWAYSFKTNHKEELLTSFPVRAGDLVWVE